MRHAALPEAAHGYIPGDMRCGEAWRTGAAGGGQGVPPYRLMIDAAKLGRPAVRRRGNATPCQGVRRYGNAGRLSVEALTSHDGRYVTPIRQFCRTAGGCQGWGPALRDIRILNILAPAPQGAATSVGYDTLLRIIATACTRLVDREASALRDFVARLHLARYAAPGGRPAARGMREAVELLRSRGYGRPLLVYYAPAGSPPPPSNAWGKSEGIIHVASAAMGGRPGNQTGIVFDPGAAFVLHTGPSIMMELLDPAGGRIARLVHAISASVNVDAVVPVWLP